MAQFQPALEAYTAQEGREQRLGGAELAMLRSLNAINFDFLGE
jgi:hypothetical protein